MQTSNDLLNKLLKLAVQDLIQSRNGSVDQSLSTRDNFIKHKPIPLDPQAYHCLCQIPLTASVQNQVASYPYLNHNQGLEELTLFRLLAHNHA